MRDISSSDMVDSAKATLRMQILATRRRLEALQNALQVLEEDGLDTPVQKQKKKAASTGAYRLVPEKGSKAYKREVKIVEAPGGYRFRLTSGRILKTAWSLLKEKGPMETEQLWAELRKSGCKSTARDPVHSIYATLSNYLDHPLKNRALFRRTVIGVGRHKRFRFEAI